MLHTKFKAPELSGSEEEISEYFSVYFYVSNPGDHDKGQL